MRAGKPFRALATNGHTMKIDVFNTTMTPFGRETTFRVMTPDGYEDGDRLYPVLYMNDGQDIFTDESAVNDEGGMRYAEYYSLYSRYLPKIIIVGIDCPRNNVERTRLYTPYHKKFVAPEWSTFENEVDGQGKQYVEWIADELKPWIDDRYRTRSQRGYTAFGGLSTGAVVTSYGVFTRPDVFSRMILLSGALYHWMEHLENTLEQCSLDHLRYIYLDVGTEERGRLTDSGEFLAGARTMRDKLASCGFDGSQLRYEEFKGFKHTFTCFRTRFPNAVRWIFQDIAD